VRVDDDAGMTSPATTAAAIAGSGGEEEPLHEQGSPTCPLLHARRGGCR
jgi:hypothetical protein